MPKCNLTSYKSKARSILKDVKAIPQRKIAIEIGESQQVISYRIKNVYPKQFEDFVRILKLAGYEIVEKTED